MPWFSPDVTDAELIFWSIPHNVSVITPVPRWPQPNGPRVAAAFRSTRMFTRWADAILSRYLVRMETGVKVGGPPPVAKNAWGWLDLGVIDDDTLEGETGEDEDGFNFRFTLRQFDSLPVAVAAGIESEIELSRSGEFWRVKREHVASQSSSGWRWNYTWQGIVQAGVSSEEESPGWLHDTEPNANRVYSVADCFTFPRQETSVQFAQFNGTSSEIQLDHVVPQLGFADFDISMDVRPASSRGRILGNTLTTRPYYTQFDSQFRWGDFDRMTLSPTWQVGVWQNIRIEVRTPPAASTEISVFIDDILVGNRLLTFQGFGGWREIGDTQFPTNLFYHGDMKNLRMEVLSGPFPGVYMDMPMDGDLLDLSPDTNHGTGIDITFGSD